MLSSVRPCFLFHRRSRSRTRPAGSFIGCDLKRKLEQKLYLSPPPSYFMPPKTTLDRKIESNKLNASTRTINPGAIVDFETTEGETKHARQLFSIGHHFFFLTERQYFSLMENYTLVSNFTHLE